MSSSSGTRDSAAGLLLVTTVVFVCLKFGGAVNWPWWIVLGPLWMPTALYLGVYVAVFLIMFTIVAGIGVARRLTPKRWWRKPAVRSARERLMRAIPRGRRRGREVYRVTTVRSRRRR
jgi:hypothetical protein